MREGASGTYETYETQSSINSMKTVYAHQRRKQDVRLQRRYESWPRDGLQVCRSAVLRVRLSARPQGAGEPGSMPAAVAAHPRTS